MLVEDSKGISFIAQNDSGNGFVTRVLNDKQYREFNGNSIIVGRQTGIVYFQPEKFVTTDGVLVLEPSEFDLNQLSGLFFTAILQNHLNHFGYTNTVSAQKLNEIEVILPTIKSKIAFNFMEKYIKALEAYLLVSGFKDYQLTQDEEEALEVFENQQWQEFRMGDLFDRVKTKKLPYKAKELPKEPQGDFSLPALTSSFMNQGLNYYVPKEGATVLQNVISIPSNSDVYRAYFQSQEFTVLSDAYAIDWIGSDKQLRPNDYLFMVPSINKVTDLPIYSYKNKLGGWNVVKDKLIKLPVNEQGEINFDYMATLVQAIKKLAIKDVVLYADKQIEATKEVVAK